jgi:hypothetical protein
MNEKVSDIIEKLSDKKMGYEVDKEQRDKLEKMLSAESDQRLDSISSSIRSIKNWRAKSIVTGFGPVVTITNATRHDSTEDKDKDIIYFLAEYNVARRDPGQAIAVKLTIPKAIIGADVVINADKEGLGILRDIQPYLDYENTLLDFSRASYKYYDSETFVAVLKSYVDWYNYEIKKGKRLVIVDLEAIFLDILDRISDLKFNGQNQELTDELKQRYISLVSNALNIKMLIEIVNIMNCNFYGFRGEYREKFLKGVSEKATNIVKSKVNENNFLADLEKLVQKVMSSQVVKNSMLTLDNNLEITISSDFNS